jgi:ubiquinone/menaquinone biosynthesis C-methylase UbiE
MDVVWYFHQNLKGCRVLDLGSGAGRDVFILSNLVGNQGYVVGVDMTKEQVSQISNQSLEDKLFFF